MASRGVRGAARTAFGQPEQWSGFVQRIQNVSIWKCNTSQLFFPSIIPWEDYSQGIYSPARTLNRSRPHNPWGAMPCRGFSAGFALQVPPGAGLPAVLWGRVVTVPPAPRRARLAGTPLGPAAPAPIRLSAWECIKIGGKKK